MIARLLQGLAGCAIALAASCAVAEPQPGRTPLPPIEPAKAGTQCVADPDVMRREHPSLLKHQRNETVHRGVRDAQSSLKGCIGCHASASTGSVAQAKTDFCVSCHSYTAVKIDCFECHASKPQGTAFHRLVNPHASAEGVRLEHRLRQLAVREVAQP